MFDSGSAIVQALHARHCCAPSAALLAEVPNRLTLEGHTDASPSPGGERGYSNWELSAPTAPTPRAASSIAGGLPDEQVLRVQGLAASKPFEPARTRPSPINRRISIIVMTREAEERVFRSPGACHVKSPCAVSPSPQVRQQSPIRLAARSNLP